MGGVEEEERMGLGLGARCVGRDWHEAVRRGDGGRFIMKTEAVPSVSSVHKV